MGDIPNLPILSIRQPWAWAIIHAGKDVENRSWPTRFRGPFLIHASAGMTRAEYQDCRETFETVGAVWGYPDGLVMPAFAALQRGGIVGSAEIIACVDDSRSPWFFGKYGFVIANARPLPFAPMKGKLGFFRATGSHHD